MKLLVLSAALLAASASAQIPSAQQEFMHQFLFVPVGIYYVDGKFVNADPVRGKDGSLQQFDDKEECFDFVKKAMLAAIKSGKAAGTIVGACMPVRRLDPSDAKRT